MSIILDIRVPGAPAAQGSLSPFISRSTGRVITPQKPKVKAYRDRITMHAVEYMAQHHQKIVDTAVSVQIFVTLARPKCHSGKHGVKASAPACPTTRPDLDKIVRAVLDALTSAVWYDDSQVVTLMASKDYGRGDGPNTAIVVYEV